MLKDIREQASDPKLRSLSLPSTLVVALVDVAIVARNEEHAAVGVSAELSEALSHLQLCESILERKG